MKTLYAWCDLALTAAAFDFVTFLVRAMKVRDERGCSHLHIVFVPDEKGHAGAFRKWGKHDEAATVWRFWHICVASLPLANATMTLAPNRSYAMNPLRRQLEGMPPNFGSVWIPDGKAHFMGPLVEAARRGEKIPALRASEQAKRYAGEWLAGTTAGPVYTITIRKQDTDEDRNSSGGMWEFAEWLEKEQRAAVIVIDDAHEAAKRGAGIFPEMDVDFRMATYELARMNFISNNGPQELLKFSYAPFMAFGQAPTPAWGDHWRKYFSMEPGEQLPWSRADQRLVYAPDTFENLKAEFMRWAYASQG